MKKYILSFSILAFETEVSISDKIVFVDLKS